MFCCDLFFKRLKQVQFLALNHHIFLFKIMQRQIKCTNRAIGFLNECVNILSIQGINKLSGS